MPKSNIGILIKCEKTIKVFIKQKCQGKDIILMDLDDNHLLIREDKLAYIKKEVYEMQDNNAYNPIEIIN